MFNASKFLLPLIFNLFLYSTLLYGKASASADASSSSAEKKEDTQNSDTQKQEETQESDTQKKEDKPEGTNSDKKDTKEIEPPKVGNFSLPTSQQPAALFGFGGNVIDKGEVQTYFFADGLLGRKKATVDLIPSVLFGITDDLSIFFNFPYSPYMRDGKNKSDGPEDFFIQLEYAFYTKKTAFYVGQATVVGNVTAPTGSIKRNPPTGYGSPSVFIGGTYYHVYIDWFLFTAQGAVLTTTENKTKVGDQFLYQWGIGRTLPSPMDWIFAWMFEIDGQYNKKNRIHGFFDHNSGGNTVYGTPSLWISNKDFLAQFGVSFPIQQKLWGKQRKFDYVINFNCAFSFY